MSHNEVANTILIQLGGNRFLLMTGAKNLLRLEDKQGGIQFDIKDGKDKINKVRIILNDNDLYDIEFGRYYARSFSYTKVKTFSDVYVDNLVEIFETTTGLYTKL